MSQDPEVLTTVTGEVRVVRVGGEFDFDTAERLARAFDPVEGRATATVLDLSQVRFADSAFLHVLLQARARHREVGAPLVLAQPAACVVRLLQVTGTAGSFAVAGTVTAAVSAARGTPGDGPTEG
ncbi:STAS domain-containing protein [Streptomyces sp. DH12]|uniref:STAS domain-containing protein n=1 Tax=Streptomyces sp. DH12 TaxID=2857010 RepID=UPI001E3FF342|nr:STAS domain-containing protein [Streptomyces sp. DH12]